MKSRIISIIALVIISYSLSWALDKPLIDPEFKKTEEKIKQLTIECEKKETKRSKRFNCKHKVLNKYEQEGKIRGTDEYCEINYSNKNFVQLEELFKKLRNQQKTARSSMDLMWNDELPGEVTKEDLQTEIMWVESRLAKIQKANIRAKEKSIKYLPGWGKNKKQE